MQPVLIESSFTTTPAVEPLWFRRFSELEYRKELTAFTPAEAEELAVLLKQAKVVAEEAEPADLMLAIQCRAMLLVI